VSNLIKRILDICISLVTVAFLLPVFVVISIAIRLISKGPAIFKQERAGGLTGLSQIYGRSELTEKTNLDLEVEYMEKQSFWLDVKIIFLTLGIVFGKKGVYEK